MSLSDQVQQRVRRLPERLQAEVLDFVEFLLAKHTEAAAAWGRGSLALAMRGMEDEEGPGYSLGDVKEAFLSRGAGSRGAEAEAEREGAGIGRGAGAFPA